MRRWCERRGPIEQCRRQRVERAIDERGLARTGHPGDAGEQAQRNAQVHIAQIVASGSQHAQHLLRIGLDALCGDVDPQAAGQILAGNGLLGVEDVLQTALGHDSSAVHAGARPDVDDVIGVADRVFVMLDDDDGVADVPQVEQRAQQAVIVALMQADGGLVENVHHAHQARADLAGQADALGLAAREGVGAATERQIVQAHVDQKAQPVLQFLENLLRDRCAIALQRQRLKVACGIGDRHCRDARQIHVVDVHTARGWFQARALTIRTWLRAQEAGEIFAHHARFSLVVAPLHVGQNAFEGVATRDGVTAIVQEVKVDLFLAAAVQHRVAMRGGEVAQGRVHFEPVVTGQGAQHLEIIEIAPVPAANGAFGQAQGVIGDDAFLVEELLQAQAVAAGAGTRRVVE